MSTARRTAGGLGEDVKEFLGEESALLAARDSVQDFSDEVDRMRDALARLDKRVARVAGHLEGRRR
ncbi:MAG: ubiquinone biosynthesis protein UbiJ [Gammaproteobacteria bacterium]